MDYKSKQSRQIKAVAIATGASILAAVATMFIPVPALESITGATGVSELVPATAAPLGDTARALIAFGAGVLTLAAMTVLLLRREAVPAKLAIVEATAVEILEDDEYLVLTFRERFAKLRLPQFKLPKMPWVKGEDDITELADLPKLRGGDIHPDAPARRPLLATSDLPALDLIEIQIEETVEDVAGPDLRNESAPEMPTAAEPLVTAGIANSDVQPSLEEMVVQLEAAVTQRQRQLDELEAVAAKLIAEKSVEMLQASALTPDPAPTEVEIPAQPVRAERPPLEAVPADPAKADDMDEALAAALATLHRMNGTDR
ncbi:MAG: hypothetical protein ABI668_06715 [Sphingorhabdus sp.]